MFDSTGSKDLPVLRLRPHHICCIQFWTVPVKERSPSYYQLRDKIMNILHLQPESRVMVIEGMDELCKECPLCIDGRCSSPLGGENEVRKWDAILLKELDIPLGTCLTSREWQALIEQKTPYKLCKKCQWKQVCSVGASLL